MPSTKVPNLLCWFLLAGISAGQAGQASPVMTHEESVVRATYGKLRFTCEQVEITQQALEATGLVTPARLKNLSSAERLAAAELQIRLSDFAVGNLSDIAERKVTDLMSLAEEKLDFQQGRHSYIADGKEAQWFELKPSWTLVNPARAHAEAATIDNLNVRDFISLQWGQEAPPIDRYAWYSVTVTYQGKTAGPYRALFLFGRDAKGTEYIEPEDSTIDATALGAVMHEHIRSDAFDSERLKNVRVVKDWTSKTPPPHCARAEEQGVCCDLAAVHCVPTSTSKLKAGAQ